MREEVSPAARVRKKRITDSFTLVRQSSGIQGDIMRERGRGQKIKVTHGFMVMVAHMLNLRAHFGEEATALQFIDVRDIIPADKLKARWMKRV